MAESSDILLLTNLQIASRALVILHLLYCYDIEELNYENVNAQGGEQFEELLFYPAVHFFRGRG